MEDELIEKEIHGFQLQRLLSQAGVRSRQQLLEPEAEEVEAPREPLEAPKESKEVSDKLLEQLRELDELLEDELIEEEVHAEQRRRLTALLAEHVGDSML